MTNRTITVSHKDGVTRIALNRPEKRNALSAEAVEELLIAVQEAQSGTRLLILSGCGKSFCAGFDFSDLDAQSDGDLALRFIRIEQLLQAVHEAPFMTMALGHGACFGAGADLFAVCRKRIAAPGTKFRMPGLQFGVVLGTRRFASLVGERPARSILEDSSVFSTDLAEQIGLVDQQAEPDAWDGLIEIASRSSQSLSAMSQRALLRETSCPSADQDLAALVRSVSQPGLQSRIRKFLKSG